MKTRKEELEKEIKVYKNLIKKAEKRKLNATFHGEGKLMDKWIKEYNEVVELDKREIDKIKKEQLKPLTEITQKEKKIYGYRRCQLCKDTIFTGWALRTRIGQRKRYFCTKNCVICYKLKQANKHIKDWRLHLTIKDYWEKEWLKTQIDNSINIHYESIFVKTK